MKFFHIKAFNRTSYLTIDNKKIVSYYRFFILRYFFREVLFNVILIYNEQLLFCFYFTKVELGLQYFIVVLSKLWMLLFFFLVWTRSLLRRSMPVVWQSWSICQSWNQIGQFHFNFGRLFCQTWDGLRFSVWRRKRQSVTPVSCFSKKLGRLS